MYTIDTSPMLYVLACLSIWIYTPSPPLINLNGIFPALSFFVVAEIYDLNCYKDYQYMLCYLRISESSVHNSSVKLLTIVQTWSKGMWYLGSW